MPGKMAGSDPRPSVRITRGGGSGQHLASVLQEGRENANIDAGLGFIWRISAKGGACGQPCRAESALFAFKLTGYTGKLAERQLPILNFRIPLFQATPSRPAWADAGFRQ